MKSIASIFLVFLSASSYSLDCGNEDYNKYWKDAVHIYVAKTIEAKLLPADKDEIIEYKLLVIEEYKGSSTSRTRTLFSEKWGPLPPVGHTALIFEGNSQLATHCNGTTNFELEWFNEENQDRADLPQKLIKKLRDAKSEKP